ncbi:TolC family protein [Planctomycetota bacterium]
MSGDRLEAIQVSPERLNRIESLELPVAAEAERSYDPNVILGTPTEQVEELALTIEQCRELALRNNLDLQVQRFSPALAEEGITQSLARFEPLALTNISYSKTDSPVLYSNTDSSQSKGASNNFSFQVPLRTGGQITLRQPLYWSTTDRESTLFPTSYTTDMSLSINQPLLRGGGIKTNEYNIRVAYYGADRAKAQTKLAAIGVLANVDRFYWRLYASRQELEVRKQEYDLAVEQSESARRKLKAGQLAEIDVLRADNAATQRLEAIILAENQVRDRERSMKQILNEAGLEMETATILISATEPNPLRYEIDSSRLVDYALSNRMELLELELQLIQDADNIAWQKNATLPLLSLDYTYNINALGTEADTSYKMMAENDFVDHRMGLTLQVPMGNKSAKSRLRQAILQHQQRLISKKQRELLIRKEVLNAVDQMEANWQRVAASRLNAELALRTFQAEQRLFDQGRSISYNLLNALASYANALSAEIRALTEYQIAQVDLAYATGSLLTAARVEWETDAESFEIDK